ncbi:MAG: hypothetical protein EOO28_16880 [Comamonadaceae bacterium]|nr:MAG: hypothetical protein EOO28_16880 [Comamonadaceae bacterium]
MQQAPQPLAGNPPVTAGDPEVERFIQGALRQAGSELAQPRPPEFVDPQAETEMREQMYGVAVGLCDAENFMQAAPLAMSLAINSPYDPRYYFLTGRAFQRLGAFNIAQTFYEHSMRNGESALACYRLAECLAAQGQAQQSIAHFDRSFELGRESGDHVALQDSALAAIERVRQQSMNKGPSI